MPKGVYKRTKPIWNKGIKTNHIPWNKGVPMAEETREKLKQSLLNSEKNQERLKSIVPQTKECKREKIRVYKDNNPEKVKKWKHDDYERNKEKYKERANKHYEDNLEAKKDYAREYQQKNIQSAIARISQWKRDNPEKTRSYSENRRARKKVGGGVVSPTDIKNIYLKQEGLCFWCKTEVNENYHLDHLIPLSRGGLHIIDNMAITCPRCNVVKNKKTPDEFRLYMKKDETIDTLINK